MGLAPLSLSFLVLSLGSLAVVAALVVQQRRRADLPKSTAWHDAKDMPAPAGLAGGEAGDALAAVLGAAGEAVVLCDARGRIEVFNPAAEMLFGCLAEEALGSEIGQLIGGRAWGLDLRALGALAAEERDRAPVQKTLTLRRSAEQQIPIRLRIRRIRTGSRWRLLVLAEDLSAHEHHESQTAYLRQYDWLTGLLNRREFERRLELLLRDPPGPRTPHILCQVDVDRFRVVNNTCGHAAGDKLLQHLALLLQSQLTGCRLLARIGGDEFAALFVDQPSEGALTTLEDVLQTVRNFLFTWQDRSFDVAVSIGLVAFDAGDETASTAFSKSDIACRAAKQQGRDRLHVYRDGDAETVRQHSEMLLIGTIRNALNTSRFRLLAQPIKPLQGNAQPEPHYEVLVRMLDESGQEIVPDRFIPAAERYILMPAVDRWIIHHLLSTQAANLRSWHARFPDRCLFAVNLSGTSLTDEGFLRYIRRQFVEWSVPFPTICFEITETATVGSLERARAFMEQLGRLGCRFALDDFGSGLSSYAYLRDLPVSYLKIDGAFVRGIDKDPVNRAMVHSINQIGHTLGIETIAEWAEDEALITTLRAMGVDYGQGFGVGEPIAVDAFALPGALQPTHERLAALD